VWNVAAGQGAGTVEHGGPVGVKVTVANGALAKILQRPRDSPTISITPARTTRGSEKSMDTNSPQRQCQFSNRYWKGLRGLQEIARLRLRYPKPWRTECAVWLL
jgi:hypothetical protein